MNRPAIVALLAAAAGPAALAQQHIDAVNKYAWSENVGWLNFADAGSPPGSQSVLIETSFLSGYVWGENIGWINMGDGTPTNGVSYANVNGTDFGVNLNTVTGHLTGYAWGENVGWINLDDATHYVGARRPAPAAPRGARTPAGSPPTTPPPPPAPPAPPISTATASSTATTTTSSPAGSRSPIPRPTSPTTAL